MSIVHLKFGSTRLETNSSQGEWWYKQEYLCEFVDTVDQVFSYESVMGAITPEVKPLFGIVPVA
jgi:hypothetical protein